MDVRAIKVSGLLISLLVMAACSQKSVSGTFPESGNSAFACDGFKIENRFLVEWEDGRITTVEAENKNVFIEKFLKPQLDQIRYVEFDRPVWLNQEDMQFETTAIGTQTTWGQAMIEADSAWNQGVRGQGVKVGVVDAAVDYTHPQLSPRLDANTAEINGQGGVDDDGNGYVDDKYGWDFYGNKPQPTITSGNVHGSHVAGIILADHNTGTLPGIAPRASLVPANFMDQGGGGTLGAAINAINYVSSRGVKVINASWGGTYCSSSLKNTVRALEQKGILFVVAAGNEGNDLDIQPEFPAAFDLPAQLTIGATRSSDFFAGFSNSSYKYVHLAAPGDQIYSTVPGGYAYLSGTSMAAPFVSGTAALLWSAKPQATLAQIRQALMNSVDVKDYRVMTRGRLNVRKALDEIRRLVP
ncbi:MAG: S8 family serine peptidase [Bdellovibrionaceae bacterium]|nr:S8 family serine peptidase [Pseudobdellovibrionaceae bacterium]